MQLAEHGLWRRLRQQVWLAVLAQQMWHLLQHRLQAERALALQCKPLMKLVHVGRHLR